MNKLGRFYRLLNILSVDVALGAVCCAAWFADYVGAQPRSYALICLGLTVWLIYTADHLLDAIQVQGEASTPRHKFHQTYFKIVLSAWVVTGCIVFILLFFIRAQVLHAGIFLIGIVAFYLLLNRWLIYLKEIAAAVIYCGGVLLPALVLNTSVITMSDRLVIVVFFLTAFINVIMFAWFDYDSDVRDGYNSFAIKFGKNFTRVLLIGLFVLQLVFLVALCVFQNSTPAILFALMNGILFMLFLKPATFKRGEYYRLLGDAIFLIPAAFLLLKV